MVWQSLFVVLGITEKEEKNKDSGMFQCAKGDCDAILSINYFINLIMMHNI